MSPIEERLSALLQAATPEPPNPVSVDEIRERVARRPVLVVDNSREPTRTSWWVSFVTASAAAVVLLVTVGVGFFVLRGDKPDKTPPLPVASVNLGFHLAYLNHGNVWFDGRQLTHDGSDNWPRVRPGGGDVAYSHGTQLWVAGTDDGEAPHLLAATGVVGRAAWSPDGTRIAYLDVEGLVVADFSGGTLVNPHRVVSGGPLTVSGTGWAALLRRTGAVAWSPDGRYLAHTGGECTSQGRSCVSLLDLTTGDDRVLASPADASTGLVSVPAFSADSATLYLTVGEPGSKPGSTVLRVVSCVVATGCAPEQRTQIGQDGDSVASPSPVDGLDIVLVTGAAKGQSWLTQLRLGTRTNLYQGYAQDWAE